MSAREPRVGSYAACPFCGERIRIALVYKRLRRGDGDWPRAAYIRCRSCNARGPIVTTTDTLLGESATDAWNGEYINPNHKIKHEGELF